MSVLALLGGDPVFEQRLDWKAFWPPVDDNTGTKLMELYRSRKWTAFDQAEYDFSEAFARRHDARHGIFTINGTVTMQCALGAYGIGPGDEVIVPALTWYATAMAAFYVGATPVMVDIEPDTLCMNPDAILSAITDRTKAIIPVHLYGSMADMDRILEIARQHDLRVIEDCAHAHGGVWAGRGIGSIGNVGSFSFQQSKTMGCAEGGMCITNDDEIAERIFRMKQIGYGPGDLQSQARNGPPPGLICYPFRATAFQALILNEQLRNLDNRLDKYDEAARYLEDRLGSSTRVRFQSRGRRADKQGRFGWVMILDDPIFAGIPTALIQEAIQAEGVPVGPTWAPVFRYILFNLPTDRYRVEGDCAVTEQVGSRVLVLLHPYLGLPQEQIEKFADAIEKVLKNLGSLRAMTKQA